MKILVLSLSKPIGDFLSKSSVTPRKGLIYRFVLPSPWLPHKHDDVFPSIASRIYEQLFSLFLDVWEVHYHGTHCGKTGTQTRSPEVVIQWVNWSAVNISLFPMINLSHLSREAHYKVKRLLEAVLQLKPEILNFRMNLSIFMKCRIP